MSKRKIKNKRGKKVHNNYGTPPWLMKIITDEFGDDLYDPCPINTGKITPDNDGLLKDWGPVSYCNPPYDAINKPRFIRKAYDEWRKGKTVILLIPAAVSTKLFHDLILPNAEVRFVEKRIRFVEHTASGEPTQTLSNPEHDSMLCVFRAGISTPFKVSQIRRP